MPAADRWHAPAPADAMPPNWSQLACFGTRLVRPTASAVLIVIARLVLTRSFATTLETRQIFGKRSLAHRCHPSVRPPATWRLRLAARFGLSPGVTLYS